MSYANEHFWIGLTDKQAEGTYVWESGQPLSAEVAAHWAYTQPGMNGIKIGLPGKVVLSKRKGLLEVLFS